MENLLITQALDERALLVKKITDKINSATFIDCIKVNEEKVMEAGVSRGDFEQQVKSSLQQIEDLIKRITFNFFVLFW